MTSPEFLPSVLSREEVVALKAELHTYVTSMPKELGDELIKGIDEDNIEILGKLVSIIKWAESYVNIR